MIYRSFVFRLSSSFKFNWVLEETEEAKRPVHLPWPALNCL